MTKRHFNCMNELCGKQLDEDDRRIIEETGQEILTSLEGVEHPLKISIVLCRDCKEKARALRPTFTVIGRH